MTLNTALNRERGVVLVNIPRLAPVIRYIVELMVLMGLGNLNYSVTGDRLWYMSEGSALFVAYNYGLYTSQHPTRFLMVRPFLDKPQVRAR